MLLTPDPHPHFTIKECLEQPQAIARVSAVQHITAHAIIDKEIPNIGLSRFLTSRLIILRTLGQSGNGRLMIISSKSIP